jgi:exosome complex component RRP46
MDNPYHQMCTRKDARDPDQLRPISCESHILSRADGSARYSSGETRVLAGVYGPREIRTKNEKFDSSTLQVEFHYPSNQHEKNGLRLYEGLLRASLEQIIMTALYPRSLILVIIQVLYDDGSVLSTSVNASILALMDAGIPIKSMLGAVTCGIMSDNSIYVDLSREEEVHVSTPGQKHMIISSLTCFNYVIKPSGVDI